MLRRKVSSATARREITKLESYPDFSLGVNYIQIGEPGTAVSDAGRDAWGVTVAVIFRFGLRNITQLVQKLSPHNVL